MKRLISKFIALMLIASIAIPQTFAMTVTTPVPDQVVTTTTPVSVSVDINDFDPSMARVYVTIQWDMSDVTTAEQMWCGIDPIDPGVLNCSVPSYTYTDSGSYDARITVMEFDSSDALLGSPVYDEFTVLVTDPLAVTLTPETQTVDSGVEATVVASITGGDGSLDTATFTWGDGSTDTYSVADSTLDPSAPTITATHTYAYGAPELSFPYPVSVTVSDGISSSTDNSTINVFSHLPTPTSTLTVDAGSDQSVTTTTPVSISANITGLDPDTASIIAQVQWDLSDPDVDSIVTMSCSVDTDSLTASCSSITPWTYSTPGIYTVNVSAHEYDISGLWLGTTASDTVDITVTSDTPPTSTLTVEAGDDQYVSVDDLVNIEACATGLDATGTQVDAVVEWGDTTSSYVAGVIEADCVHLDTAHPYSSAGTYTVTVTANEYDGSSSLLATDVDTLQVVVSEGSPFTTPLVVEAGDDQYVSVDDLVTITPTSTGGDGTLSVATVAWGDIYDTSDDLVYNSLPAGDLAITPTHTFTAGGTYTVTVTATDDITPAVFDTLTVYVEGPCVDDACEENDSAQVPTLTSPLPYSIAGMICEDDVDYYAVTLNEGDTVTADLDYTYADGDLVLYVTTWDLTDPALYVMGDTLDDDETVTYTAATSGDYYVVVTGGGHAENSYGLAIDVIEAAPSASYDLAVTDITYDPATEAIIYTITNQGDTIDLSTFNSNNLISVNYNDGSATTSSNYRWEFLADTDFLNTGDSSTIYYYLTSFDVDSIASVTVYTDEDDLVPEDDKEDNNYLTLEFPTPSTFSVEAGSAQTVTLGNAVTITAISTGGNMYEDMFSWGDGTSTGDAGYDLGTSVSHSYTYAAIGTYTVTTSVEDASGNEASDTVVVTVIAADGGDTGEASLSIYGGVDQSITLGDTAAVQAVTSDSDGSLEWMEFNWGDSSTNDFYYPIPEGVFGMTGTHTYSAAGTYTVTITTTDGTSPTATDTLTITVTDTASQPSTFVVEAGIDQAMYLGTPSAVRAIATGLSAEGVGANASINWGDATTDSVIGVLDAMGVTFDAMHTYTAVGTYTVTVDATELNSDGLEIVTVSDTLTIVVKPVETTTPPPSGGATYGGGAGSSSSSSSSSSTEDDQDVVVADDGSTTEDDQIVIVAEEDTTVVDVCAELPFTDVSPNASYYDAIYQSWCEGIVHGRAATTFAPADAIQRGEVAKVVAGVFGYAPVANLTETSYVDLDASEPLAPYIQALTDAGILQGYTDNGTFKAYQYITISEIEALMYRVTGSLVDVSSYSDDGVTVSRGRFMEFILQYLN